MTSPDRARTDGHWSRLLRGTKAAGRSHPHIQSEPKVGPKTMTISGQSSQDREGRLGAWVRARWQWLIVAVLLLFALNKLVGGVVGAVGLIVFANRLAGRLLAARRVVQQVHQVVSDPDDSGEES